MTTTTRQLSCRRPVPSLIRGGFTMVELIVTISIIAVLVALTVYAASSLVLRSETQRTQDMLKILESAAQEWELTAERQMTQGENDVPAGAMYDINELILEVPVYAAVTPPDAIFIVPPIDTHEAVDLPALRLADDISRRYIRRIAQSSAPRETIARIDAKLVRKGNDTGTDPDVESPHWMIIRDAWDMPVRVVLPGRDWIGTAPVSDPIEDKNADGTFFTDYEKAFGICQARRSFFVSAGPDGKYGHLHLDVATADLGADEREDIALAADNVYSTMPGMERSSP